MAKIKLGKNTSKKEVIIKNASSLFRTKGFNAASMRELAEAVGVEAPSLYNHIGSKSELLQTICFKVASEFTGQLEATENKNTSITTKIELIIRFHITMMLDEFDEVFVANHEWKHLQEPFLSNFLNQRRSYEKRLVAIIEQGIQKKELKNINPYVAVLTLLSAVRGLEFWQRHKKNISARVLEDDMVTHLLNGMIK
jgi:TetR/AcrR family transcriptional regulator, cholesterol catabolism regulator